MEYKGYIGSVEVSEEDGVFFGKVQGIRSLIYEMISIMRLKIILLCAKKIKGVGELAIPG